MNKVTYQIRVDARDWDIIWIDQYLVGTLVRTHGPYFSLWEAGNQIRKWEAAAEVK